MCAVVTQALLEGSANMCNSATSQFGLKIIQRGRFSDESFITFSFQMFHSRRRSSGILVSQFNPLLHSSWINNFIFTMIGSMRLKVLKIEPIALKIPFFVYGTTLFEGLNLSISIIPSQVITSILFK